MHVIRARNVNEAYSRGLSLLMNEGERSTSRAGDVIVLDEPVTTVYSRPCERVLFDERRDANPFFHLFESIWMLAGRDDVVWLDRFVKDFSARFAEPDMDGRSWGAYGDRWRAHFDTDQLSTVVHRLRRDPNDRRSVIAMWDTGFDLQEPDEIDPDTGEAVWPEAPEPRDLPCNTHVYLRIMPAGQLDMMVSCRSNDIIWGAYGANAVHFSVLQEYLATRIGVEVGCLYQVSWNWHGYVNVVEKVSPPDSANEYETRRLAPTPMFTVPHMIDRDILRFMESPYDSVYANSWFHNVAVPMLWAHDLFRKGDHDGALIMLDQVRAPDWQIACRRWIARRARK